MIIGVFCTKKLAHPISLGFLVSLTWDTHKVPFFLKPAFGSSFACVPMCGNVWTCLLVITEKLPFGLSAPMEKKRCTIFFLWDHFLLNSLMFKMFLWCWNIVDAIILYNFPNFLQSWCRQANFFALLSLITSCRPLIWGVLGVFRFVVCFSIFLCIHLRDSSKYRQRRFEDYYFPCTH